jgi:hypothetical protein
MRQTIPILLFQLLTLHAWAQRPSADKTEMNANNKTKSQAIQRVKALLASSLDRDLPKVTLEFFLSYEGEGNPITWEVNDCDEKKRDPAVNHERDSAMCVRATIGLKDGRAATVLISLGMFKKGAVDVPTVYAVSVTYPGGTIHRLDRLSDLPVELHRPLPKGPKDLPAPVSA